MLPYLYETKDIITKWILSCETAEQLDLIMAVIERFVFERFIEHNPTELDMVKTELNESVLTQRLMIVLKLGLTELHNQQKLLNNNHETLSH